MTYNAKNNARKSRIIRYLARQWQYLEWEDVIDDLAVVFWFAVSLYRRDFRLDVNQALERVSKTVKKTLRGRQ
jgi:hypothetical protein